MRRNLCHLVRRTRRSIAGTVLLLLTLAWALMAPRAPAAALSLKSDTSTKSEKGSSIPGGSLEANEKRGGHILSRHVGKTVEELRHRLATDSHISAASSFTDQKTAEMAIDAAIKAQSKRIESWLRGEEDRLALTHRSTTSVGLSVSRGARSARDAYRVRMVLVRDKNLASEDRLSAA